MIDIFTNNAMIKTIVSFVNFCNEQTGFCYKKLKFSKNMPLNKTDNTEYLFGKMTAKLNK